MSSQNASLAAVASTTTLLLGAAWLATSRTFRRGVEGKGTTADADSLPSVVASEDGDDLGGEGVVVDPLAVLPCIRDRRSVFPSAFMKNPPHLPKEIIQSLLDAALYGPFHGKCYKGNMHPARFVVLGKEAMVEMQRMTIRFYDAHWTEHWSSEEDYQSFRKCTEDEIVGRWGPVSYMIAIVMRRQSGPRRFPEWEEAAATACAVQNMHVQSGKFKRLACYWSSWHDAARDSAEMREFLSMGDEDRCMGFFIVAHARNPEFRPRRDRDRSLISVEWRE